MIVTGPSDTSNTRVPGSLAAHAAVTVDASKSAAKSHTLKIRRFFIFRILRKLALDDPSVTYVIAQYDDLYHIVSMVAQQKIRGIVPRYNIANFAV